MNQPTLANVKGKLALWSKFGQFWLTAWPLFPQRPLLIQGVWITTSPPVQNQKEKKPTSQSDEEFHGTADLVGSLHGWFYFGTEQQGVLFERTPCNLTRRYTFKLYGGVPLLSRYFSAQAIISLLASPSPFRRTHKMNQSLPFLTISKEMHVMILASIGS